MQFRGPNHSTLHTTPILRRNSADPTIYLTLDSTLDPRCNSVGPTKLDPTPILRRNSADPTIYLTLDPTLDPRRNPVGSTMLNSTIYPNPPPKRQSTPSTLRPLGGKARPPKPPSQNSCTRRWLTQQPSRRRHYRRARLHSKSTRRANQQCSRKTSVRSPTMPLLRL